MQSLGVSAFRVGGHGAVVIVACLLRLWFYIRRRRSQRFRTWQPTEIIMVRSLAELVTGRPVTGITWKHIDALLLTILLLALAFGFSIR